MSSYTLNSNASDTFREKFLNERKAIASWTKPYMDLDQARILDFGCGLSIAALSFALEYPEATVFGYDPTTKMSRLDELVTRNMSLDEMPTNLQFSTEGIEALASPGFDLVYSWSVFEHIRLDELGTVFEQLRSILKSNALLFLQIAPLFYSSRGAHLYRIIGEPWVHLLQQHDVLKDRFFADSELPASGNHLPAEKLEREGVRDPQSDSC